MSHVIPEVILRVQPAAQSELPLAAEDVQRWVWESQFGPMLIEVRNGEVFVNGEQVDVVGSQSDREQK